MKFIILQKLLSAEGRVYQFFYLCIWRKLHVTCNYSVTSTLDVTLCGIVVNDDVWYFFSILSLKLPIKVIESNFYILFKLNLTALLFTTNWLGWIVWKLKPHVIKHNKKVGYRILRRQLKAWNVKSQSRCCFWTHTIYILERSGIST